MERISVFLKKLGICSVVVLASGCASVYVPPNSGPVASLTLPASNKNFGWVSSSFEALISEKRQDGCGSLHKLSNPNNEDYITVDVPANSDIFLVMGATIGLNYCVLSSKFYSEPGKRYEAEFDVKNRVCSSYLYEIDGKKYERVNLEVAYSSKATGLTICESEELL